MAYLILCLLLVSAVPWRLTGRVRGWFARSQVVRLLNDVPSGQLPLVKFMELYEQRFHSTVSIADLFRSAAGPCLPVAGLGSRHA